MVRIFRDIEVYKRDIDSGKSVDQSITCILKESLSFKIGV